MAGQSRKRNVPTEVAAEGVQPGQPGMPMFPARESPPGSAPVPEWEPGVVEVEFRHSVSPEIAAAAAAADAITSAAGADLASIHEVLQRHAVTRVEPSFRASVTEAAAGDTVLNRDPTVPPLDSFVTLYFPPEADLAAVAQELNQLPEVERAVPVPRAIPPEAVPLEGTPLDEPLVGTGDQVVANSSNGLENQWYLFRCRANQAWGLSTGDEVVIADIDWGYRTTHQDLAPRLDLSHAFNSFDGSTNVSHGDSTSHGTAVLGIAGGADNDRGMAGFAPMATLWPIQANSGSGPPLTGNPWANAIEWVRLADSGGRRKVIILEVQTGTFGNYEMVPSVNAAIQRAIASGVVVCVAAGNGNRDADRDDLGNPIPETGSILVGATAYDPEQNPRAWFSNFGARISLAAPGDSDHDVTCSIAADNAYQNAFGGTSGATPKVAGAAALMLSVNPQLSHAEVREILRATGFPVVSEPGKPIGHLLDTEAAVREALRRRSDGHAPPLTGPSLRRVTTPGAKPAAAADQTTSGVTLREFLNSAAADSALTKAQRLLLVEQALLLLEQFYVHRPLKEAMHGERPIQRLKLLQYCLEQTPEGQLPNELRFHNQMTEIFVSVRDLHTNYLLPSPYRDRIAYLPFLVEEYWEDSQRRYIVSKVVQGFTHPTFKPGVEVLYWSGVPIDRAVEINADQQAGSNTDARHARGLDALTIRPLIVSLPPDALWETIRYRTPDGAELELVEEWQVFTRGAGPAFVGAGPEALVQDAAFGIDVQADAVRQAKQALFAPPSVAAALDPTAPAPPAGAALGPLPHEAALGIDIQTDVVRQAKQVMFAPEVVAEAARVATEPAPAAGADEMDSRMPLVLNARAVETPDGIFGYLRIYTFSVDDPDAFIAEFVRLASLLPQNGLIVDVRGNGGGLIYAGECLLQVLTPSRIQPERFQFINTPLTLELCRRHRSAATIDLSPWLASMEQAIATNAVFSRSVPITPDESCNTLGQKYVGPVVLITDALCYSTTDMFAAGFQDHGIGRILGVSGNTGAGGANVWTHGLLQRLFSGGSNPFKGLPSGADMRVAIRQSVRVGPNEGTLLEDLGVVPDDRHAMTKNDLLNGNPDLIDRAASILKQQKGYGLKLEVGSRSAGNVAVRVQTKGLNRLDFFLNGRPQQSLDISDGELPFTVAVPTVGSVLIELRGYDRDRFVAARRERL